MKLIFSSGNFLVYKAGDDYIVKDEDSGDVVFSSLNPHKAIAKARELHGEESRMVELGPGELFHLTRRNLGEEILLDPKHARLDVYESMPGVSFAPSIEQAFGAMPTLTGPGNLGYGYKYKKYYVYSPKYKTEFIEPDVDDIEISGEKRSLIPIQAKRVGKIKIRSEVPFEYENI